MPTSVICFISSIKRRRRFLSFLSAEAAVFALYSYIKRQAKLNMKNIVHFQDRLININIFSWCKF